MREIIGKLVERRELLQEDIDLFVDGIREGKVSDVQIAGFLVGLLMKGPTTREIAAIARAMRRNAIRVRPKVNGALVDTCGTGGGLLTFNVSTANALLSAAAGVYVAKHGSKSISGPSGSADALQALGIAIDLTPKQAERLLEEAGFAFLYAPLFHPVMLQVFGPENELGIKTIFFTIIGPLINPADARRHVLGVYRPELVEQVAEVVTELGFEHALIVHGLDGVDEISILGETKLAEVRNGKVDVYTIAPEDLGKRRCGLEEVRGGDPEYNAKVIREIFEGKERGPKRDFLALNAGATLYVAGKARSIAEGVRMAEEILDSGRALAKLEEIASKSWEIKERVR